MKFLERKRRKGWIGRGEDEVCWEVWTVKVTVAEPKTDNGEPPFPTRFACLYFYIPREISCPKASC